MLAFGNFEQRLNILTITRYVRFYDNRVLISVKLLKQNILFEWSMLMKISYNISKIIIGKIINKIYLISDCNSV